MRTRTTSFFPPAFQLIANPQTQKVALGHAHVLKCFVSHAYCKSRLSSYLNSIINKAVFKFVAISAVFELLSQMRQWHRPLWDLDLPETNRPWFSFLPSSPTFCNFREIFLITLHQYFDQLDQSFSMDNDFAPRIWQCLEGLLVVATRVEGKEAATAI